MQNIPDPLQDTGLWGGFAWRTAQLQIRSQRCRARERDSLPTSARLLNRTQWCDAMIIRILDVLVRLARRLDAIRFKKVMRLMMCDVETDFLCVASIVRSIDHALSVAEAERATVSLRIDNILARAAVTSGNDVDEYVTRDSLDIHHQNLFDTEISDGRLRLEQLSQNIKHFRFLREALLTRFPDLKMVSDTGMATPLLRSPF
ncbi:hypothetical protein Q2941_35400 [Bradyrhizobium sp. UFLA05-153]